MKKIITLFCYLISIQTAFSQSQYTDSILQKIAVEKDENIKVDLIFSIYAPGFDSKPSQIIESRSSSAQAIRGE